MGNQITIYGPDDKVLGTATHGLRCGLYAEKICQKYVPAFSFFNQFILDNWGKFVSSIYDHCTEAERLALYLFLEDDSSFDARDLPVFDQLIKDLEENLDGITEGILAHVKAYRKILEEYGFLRTAYNGITTVAMTVTKGAEPGDSQV